MPTFSKIPKSEVAKGSVACGSFVVFGGGILSVGGAMEKLQSFTKAIPAYGYITISGKRWYYCKYGFVSDESIYT